MNMALVHFARILGNLLKQEDGQDLVEYALVIALIALGATAGMNSLASSISSAFSSVGGMITADI